MAGGRSLAVSQWVKGALAYLRRLAPKFAGLPVASLRVGRSHAMPNASAVCKRFCLGYLI